MSVPKPPWTDEELGFLQDHDDWSAPRVAAELHRSASAVKQVRRRLRAGWTRVAPEPWTVDEDEVLTEGGAWVTAHQLAEKLPGRTKQAIDNRRQVLGIKSAGTGTSKSPHSVSARPLIAKTCTTCGKLLQADWFAWRTSVRLWSSTCRLCDSTRSQSGETRPGSNKGSKPETQARNYRRVQAVTLATATRHRQPWTEKDHEVLSNPDLTRLQKALQLGRSYAAVNNACHANGYKSHVGLGEPTDLWRIFNPNEPEVAA